MSLTAPFPVQSASVQVQYETFYRLLDDLFSEGVARSTDFEVLQNGAGTNLSVNVSPGDGYVNFGSATYGGTRRVRSVVTSNSGAPGEAGPDFLTTFQTPHPTLPRVDRVTIRMEDADLDTSAQRRWRYRVEHGSATSGATLGNLLGAPTVPDNSMLIANVLLAAAATTIVTANIDTSTPSVRARATIGSGRVLNTVAPTGLVKLFDSILGAPGTFDFNNIPQTYHALLLVGDLRGALASVEGTAVLRFNADAGAVPSKYGWSVLNASGTVVSSDADVADTDGAGLGTVPGNSAGAGLFAGLHMWLPAYAGAVNHKAGTWHLASKSGTAAGDFKLRTGTVWWDDPASITRIQLGEGSGFVNFQTGSRLTLWGLAAS